MKTAKNTESYWYGNGGQEYSENSFPGGGCQFPARAHWDKTLARLARLVDWGALEVRGLEFRRWRLHLSRDVGAGTLLGT